VTPDLFSSKKIRSNVRKALTRAGAARLARNFGSCSCHVIIVDRSSIKPSQSDEPASRVPVALADLDRERKLMCRILNAKQVGEAPSATRVYVGRPSKWGNPFVIGRDGSRDEVIARYRAWIVTQPELMSALHELRGKDLICWCAPEACHAEVLKDFASANSKT